MEIKVYGSGCARCTETARLVSEVLAAKGLTDVKVEKVSDYKEMMLAGIMSTPAVAINGMIKIKGSIPSKDDIAKWLDEAS